MDEPLFLVTNKTGGQLPWAENDDPRVYFSLSDHYWPFQVSSVNRNGIPYSYNASVNPEVCKPCCYRIPCKKGMGGIHSLCRLVVHALRAAIFSTLQGYSCPCSEEIVLLFSLRTFSHDVLALL